MTRDLKKNIKNTAEGLTCDHTGGDERKDQALQHPQKQLSRKGEIFLICEGHAGGSQCNAHANALEEHNKGQ